MRNKLRKLIEEAWEAQGGERSTAIADLVAMPHICRTSVWRWLNGHTTPRYGQLLVLADALDIPIEEVLDAVGHPARVVKRRRARASGRV